MNQLINLTPHEVRIHGAGEPVVIPASGDQARVAVTYREEGCFYFEKASVPVMVPEYGDIEGLPAPKEGVFYFVSRMVVLAVRATGDTRTDLFVPGELVRDQTGRPVGCNGIVAA